MNRKQLEEKAQSVVAQATQKGADTVVVGIEINRFLEVGVRSGDLEQLSQSVSHGLSLTVSVDQRRAVVSSNDFSESAVAGLIDQALALTRHCDVDPDYTLPDPDALAFSLPDVTLDQLDPELMVIPVETWVGKSRELEKAALGMDRRLRSDGAGFEVNHEVGVLANSLGFCQSYEESDCSCSVELFAEEKAPKGSLNSQKKQSGGAYSTACWGEDLEGPQEVAQRASADVLRKLGARRPKTGKFPVYFEPAMARTLWRHLLSAMKGSLIYRQESYLMEALGSEVGSSLVTLKEDPFLPRRGASRLYDSEGVLVKPATLVDQGVLQTFLLSTYSAKKLSMKTTGHAGGVSNILVPAGQRTREELLREMGTGLWLTGVSGQGVKLSTGDYSRGASGLWVERGEVVHAVDECTINSTLPEVFRGIVAMDNGVESRFQIQTPGLLVASLSLAGVS